MGMSKDARIKQLEEELKGVMLNFNMLKAHTAGLEAENNSLVRENRDLLRQVNSKISEHGLRDEIHGTSKPRNGWLGK